MGKKFNHLHVPEHWQQYWSKYPEGYTIMEALINWVSQVDDMVDNVNGWNDYLQEFVSTFDDNLRDEVSRILKDWQKDGTLKVVITESLNSRMDNVEKDMVDFRTDINTRLDNLGSMTPKEVFNTVGDMVDKYPNGAEGVMLAQSTGHWYYWNGDSWTDGGVYQASPWEEYLTENGEEWIL